MTHAGLISLVHSLSTRRSPQPHANTRGPPAPRQTPPLIHAHPHVLMPSSRIQSVWTVAQCSAHRTVVFTHTQIVDMASCSASAGGILRVATDGGICRGAWRDGICSRQASSGCGLIGSRPLACWAVLVIILRHRTLSSEYTFICPSCRSRSGEIHPAGHEALLLELSARCSLIVVGVSLRFLCFEVQL